MIKNISVCPALQRRIPHLIITGTEQFRGMAWVIVVAVSEKRLRHGLKI
jgi:hypothetical protein